MNNWIQDYGEIGWKCDIEVIQKKDGSISDFNFRRNCVNDKNFRESIKKAVYKSSPLPLPEDPKLFDSKIKFTFLIE